MTINTAIYDSMIWITDDDELWVTADSYIWIPYPAEDGSVIFVLQPIDYYFKEVFSYNFIDEKIDYNHTANAKQYNFVASKIDGWYQS